MTMVVIRARRGAQPVAFNHLNPSTYTKRAPKPIPHKPITYKVLGGEMLEILGYIHESGLMPYQIVTAANEQGYSIAASTIYRWLEEKTHRPHYYSVRAVMAALGYRMSWTRRSN
jgi:hypothetical protein